MRLLGKRFVLDPGHGQGATGAIGRGGTLECEVNIRVTRHLQGLLQRAGATVWVTWDVLEEWTLENRARLARQVGADVFISVHHNATEPPDPLRNRIEVYYPWENLPEARDLAEYIGQALHQYSGFFLAPPMPARYRVLRGNVPLSVLLEPGYLSHREVERLLADRRYQLGEAEAIFEGIVRFFEAPTPRVRRTVVFPGGVRVRLAAPEAVEVVVWNHGLPIARKLVTPPRETIWVPLHLPNGRHSLQVEVRPRQGRSWSMPTTLELQHRPVRVKRIRGIQAPGVAGIEVQYLDYRGRPVDPSTVVVPPGVEHRRLSAEGSEGPRFLLLSSQAFTLAPHFGNGGVEWGPGSAYRLLPLPGRWLRFQTPEGVPVPETPQVSQAPEGVVPLPGGLGVPEGAQGRIQVTFPSFRAVEISLASATPITVYPKPLAGHRVVILQWDLSEAWQSGVARAARELQEQWGVQTVVWPAHRVHRDPYRLVLEVEALNPSAIVLLDTYYRWPRGIYAYYRSGPSRRLAEALAQASQDTSTPLQARTGSTYFLIQANPPRVQINGLVPAPDLAQILLQGLVRFLQDHQGR